MKKRKWSRIIITTEDHQALLRPPDLGPVYRQHPHRQRRLFLDDRRCFHRLFIVMLATSRTCQFQGLHRNAQLNLQYYTD